VGATASSMGSKWNLNQDDEEQKEEQEQEQEPDQDPDQDHNQVQVRYGH